MNDPIQEIRDALEELIAAMHKYEMDVDVSPTYKHKEMMDRADSALLTLQDKVIVDEEKVKETLAKKSKAFMEGYRQGRMDVATNCVTAPEFALERYLAKEEYEAQRGQR